MKNERFIKHDEVLARENETNIILDSISFMKDQILAVQAAKDKVFIQTMAFESTHLSNLLDEVRGSDRAMNYVAKHNMDIEIIRGMEVSSQAGHVLALNIEGVVKPNMTLVRTIKEIHKQGGLAIIAHPQASRTNSVSFNEIADIINSEDLNTYIDGIELFNGSNINKILAFVEANIKNPKLGVLLGSSDGHTQRIGSGLSIYSQESVINAIINKETCVVVANTSFIEDTLDTALMTYAIIQGHLSGSIKHSV